MSGRPARIFSTLIFIIIIILVSAGRSSAQSGAVAQLSAPDASKFPHLTAFLDVHDPQGEFVHGLTTKDVVVQEDGVVVTPTELEELTPGVQFVIAISPGTSFVIRDGMGTSRYEYLLQGLLASNWPGQSAGSDDFSLLTLGGPQLTHTNDAEAIKSAIESYNPASQEFKPGLEILASALQVASDPAERPGMERAILFITSPQETDVSLGLQSIIASANQQNVHIYVLMLAAEEAFQAPEIAQLRNLADQTGGSFWGFSRNEPVPDLERILEPMRHIYRLGYDSQVTTQGPHQVNVQVPVAGATIGSQAQSFEVNLQPPVVSLLDPPHEITRTYSGQPTPATGDIQGDLIPVEQMLQIKIAFPDGYSHSIIQTRLYVDGAVVAQNSNPPFDQFTWDLRQFAQDGTHTLMVDATDNLGLLGKSPEASVRITVPSTTQGMMVAVTQKSPLLLAAAAVVGASLLVLVLIVGGHIRPKPHPGQPRQGKRTGVTTRIRGNQGTGSEPAVAYTAVINASTGKAAGPLLRWWARLPWLKRKEEPVLAKAHLTPLVGFDEPTLPSPLQIVSDDISLGSDPHRATLVINELSIEAVHAFIHLDGSSFAITDAGTVAGTWVNYEQAAPSGTTLVHMDIIHLGRIGFRFQVSESGRTRKVVVTPLEQRQ